MYAKVKDHNNLIRDMSSKAVLNTDKAGLNDYLMKREIAKKQQNEQSETKMRLAQLEQDMSEIKSLLQDIANMRKYG
jgi:transposase-like protein